MVEEWHLVAHARQLMLTHSFSFLPIRLDGKWKLISEMSIARFLSQDRKKRLAMSIKEAAGAESALLCSAEEIRPKKEVSTLLQPSPDKSIANHGRIWLVTGADGSDRLLGILTPFELM